MTCGACGYAKAAWQPAILFMTQSAVQVVASTGRGHHPAHLSRRGSLMDARLLLCKRTLYGLSMTSLCGRHHGIAFKPGSLTLCCIHRFFYLREHPSRLPCLLGCCGLFSLFTLRPLHGIYESRLVLRDPSSSRCHQWRLNRFEGADLSVSSASSGRARRV